MRATAITGVLFVVVATTFASTVKVRVGSTASANPAVSAALSQPIVRGAGRPLFAVRSVSPAITVPLIMPVANVAPSKIEDSWGDPRDNGLREHHGTDILAPAGTPVVAAAPGIIEKLHVSAAGGTTLYVRSPDRQWSYYYAHLGNYAPGLHEGQRVDSGDLIGFVGDTGNAGTGNYHLHFGLSHMSPSDGWWQGTPVDPYPSLAGKSGPG